MGDDLWGDVEVSTGDYHESGSNADLAKGFNCSVSIETENVAQRINLSRDVASISYFSDEGKCRQSLPLIWRQTDSQIFANRRHGRMNSTTCRIDERVVTAKVSRQSWVASGQICVRSAPFWRYMTIVLREDLLKRLVGHLYQPELGIPRCRSTS